MFKHDEFARRHFAAGGGAVVLEHQLQGLPEFGQVFVGKAGFGGKVGGDKAVHAVKGYSRLT